MLKDEIEQKVKENKSFKEYLKEGVSAFAAGTIKAVKSAATAVKNGVKKAANAIVHAVDVAAAKTINAVVVAKHWINKKIENHKARKTFNKEYNRPTLKEAPARIIKGFFKGIYYGVKYSVDQFKKERANAETQKELDDIKSESNDL